ncbi:MAG: tetratricopeptide repeat protein [Brevinema sp.]
MQKNLIIIMLMLLPCLSQSYDSALLQILDLDQENIFSNTHKQQFNNIIQIFQQKRYNLFLKEINQFQPLNDSLLLLKGIALMQENDLSQAETILKSLTTHQNLEIRHQALLYLYQSSLNQNNITSAKQILQIVHNSPIGSPYKEITHVKLLYLSLQQQEARQSQILSQSFEALYPNSIHISEIQYFTALNNISLGRIDKAKKYAESVLKTQTNIQIQRLMGEIFLQENNIPKALSYFLPIAEQYNPYQDEALYKSALLYKQQKNFQEAHHLLNILLNYHKNSSYAARATAELAYLNILLKNYDDALIYYLRESNGDDRQKANALLKITEIHFLKSNTTAVKRTTDRIQSLFPYSAFANESLYWLGRSYLLEKNYTNSIQNFDKYLTREPQSPKKDEILIFLGHSYANIGNHTKARNYFQQIINDSSNEQLKRQALIGLGKSYSTHEARRSLEYFDRIWKIWAGTPESIQALYYSAAIRYNLRMNNESLSLFKKLAQEFPESSFHPDTTLAIAKLEFKSENFNNIINKESFTSDNPELLSEFKELQARSFFRIGQYEKALPLFKESSLLTKNQTRKTDLFLAEASTLRALGQHKEAVKNYEQYLKALEKTGEINNLQELLWSEIVFSYLEIQNMTKAEKTTAYIQSKFPQSTYLSDIYFRLADEYFAKEIYPKSSQYYYQARLSSTNELSKSEALLREGWSKYYAKDPQTQESFELFLRQYPKHIGIPDITLKLAELYSLKNDPRDRILLQTLIQNYPDSHEAEKARIFFAQRLNIQNNINEFYEALATTQDKRLKAKYLYTLGLKFKEANNFNEAIQIFKDIHTLRDPIHGADALFLAGDLLFQQENYQDSLKVYINIIAQYQEEHYPKALDRIIQTYILLEEYNNAEKFKERLITQFPNSKETQRWLR